MEEIAVDYVVIGAGIAGLSAAKVLSEHGSTVILTKGKVRESSTHWAQGGIAAALDQGDAPSYHMKDTLSAGAGLCDPEMVKILVEEGPECVQELIQLGANFDREGETLSLTMEAAHGKRRILHAGDATGREIEKTLGAWLLKQATVAFHPNMSVMALLLKDGECTGCVAKQGDRWVSYHAKATILATGGACQVYSRNTNPPLSTGDGMSLAYQAGCTLKDMEFVQFHPTTLYTGDQRPISLFLISEAVRGEGGVLRNIFGERFIQHADPRAELAPRDVVARSIFSEMRRTDAPYVYLDLTQMDIDVHKRFPTISERCATAKIDISREFVPVAPAAHYFVGGVETNAWGQTEINRLYAAGEVAATGIHGANRLASNSLLEGLVFGKRAALHASSQPQCSSSKGEIPAAHSYDEVALMTFKQSLKHWVNTYAGIVRNQAGLLALKDRLQRGNWIKALPSTSEEVAEVKNMLIIAELICQFALDRKESRGAHYREDFPDMNSDYQDHQRHHLTF